MNTLQKNYTNIRRQTLKIVEPLKVEDYVAQPVVDVSPPKWHLGHSTWFFENFILKKHATNYKLFDEGFAFIFNSYYESQGERILRNKRGTLTRPSVEEIFKYRRYVDDKMLEFLASDDLDKELLLFLNIGLNHEQQHQELLITDIKYILGSNPLLAVYNDFKIPIVKPNELEWLKVAEGNYQIGYEGTDFHFDNEKGIHQVYLHSFECMNRLVTNKEYLDFINDDGYGRAELWLSEGWDWVKSNEAIAPFYWFEKDGKWFAYQLNGVEEINLNLPVTHINFFEAEAFARWKNCRLLTEYEWEVAANKYGNYTKAQFQENGIFQPSAGGNQFFGTAWEWTNSAYLPYPYYQQDDGALGEYNGKFMVNQMVLRGGSCATPKEHFRPSYRNFFQTHLQWQFTGIRLARHI